MGYQLSFVECPLSRLTKKPKMNNWPQISIIVINDGHSEKSQRHHARFAQKEIHKLDYRVIINVGDFGGTTQKIETFQKCQSNLQEI